MLGSSPHQRPGTVPPGTNVACGLRSESERIAVMNFRFVPRHTFVSNHLLVPSEALGITIRSVESVDSGLTSNSAPCVSEVNPAQTPAGGSGAFSELSVRVVPAGGVPAFAVYCTPPWVPLTEQAAPVQVVEAIGVAPHGSTSIEIAAGVLSDYFSDDSYCYPQPRASAAATRPSPRSRWRSSCANARVARRDSPNWSCRRRCRSLSR